MIKKVVKMKLGKESTGHDYLHAMRVLNNAMEIAKHYNVDLEVIKAASLVHDLIDRKLDDKYKLSIEEITNLLQDEKLSDKQCKLVINIIENMSYSKGNVPESLEGKIVQDADRLDALGAIGIARTFAYGGKNERLLYGDENNEDSLYHFHDKLYKLPDLMNTQHAKKIALERITFMKEFERTLLREIE